MFMSVTQIFFYQWFPLYLIADTSIDLSGLVTYMLNLRFQDDSPHLLTHKSLTTTSGSYFAFPLLMYLTCIMFSNLVLYYVMPRNQYKLAAT